MSNECPNVNPYCYIKPYLKISGDAKFGILTIFMGIYHIRLIYNNLIYAEGFAIAFFL